MKCEKKYYADSEDAYEMMKFFKPEVEEKMMKKVTEPIISTFPGATYPITEYPHIQLKKKSVNIEQPMPPPNDKKPEEKKIEGPPPESDKKEIPKQEEEKKQDGTAPPAKKEETKGKKKKKKNKK